MSVPLLDLSQQHAALQPELIDAFTRVLHSGHFILGEEVEAFEQEVGALIGAKHAIAMSSGSDALLAALMAISIQPGDEVITTAYSFFATAGCVARLGALPVFVDIDPHTLNIDVEQIASVITSRTRAIIPVHLFGLPADMEKISSLAAEHDLIVIEDACQAIGAHSQGRAVGTLGDMATFSFFPSKNLGGLGDGGLLTTANDEFAVRVRMLRAHGSRVKYHHEIIGGNFRLDALQAALLRVKLPHLANWNEARRNHADLYSRLLLEAGCSALQLPPQPADRTHVFHQYVIRITERDSLRRHLKSRDIHTEVYYPLPLHRQPCFHNLDLSPLPHAERAALESLALPIFPELLESQQREVVAAIAEYTSKLSRA